MGLASTTTAKALRGIGVLALTAALGACVTEWDKPEFDIPIAGKFRAAATPPADPVPDRWVDGFGSRELSTLAERALADNLDIAQAVARIIQADAQARIASAPLSPLISSSNSSSRSQTSGALTSQDAPNSPTRRSLYNLGLTASYEVDFWSKNQDGANAGRLLAQATRYDRAVVALSTIASLANSYFAVLGAQDRVRIAQSNIRIAETVLRAVRERIQVGTATALDLAQQESIAASQRAQVPPLEQIVQQTRNLLAVLIGQTPESVTIRGGSLNGLRIPRVQPGIPSQLLLRRPDVAEAEARVVSQDFTVGQARAAFFPSVQLTGQFGVQSIVLKNLFRPEAIAYQFALGLAQPIIDGGNIRGQYELQKGRYAELFMAYNKQVLTAFSDVENALIAVRQRSEYERLQGIAVAAAQRALDVALKRLQEGTIDIVTLSTTQTQLFQAQDLLSQVRLTRFQAIVGLYQALGGGWDDVKRELANLAETDAYAKQYGLLP